MEESQEAGKLADEYQPVIVQAEKDKRAADLEFQKFAQATSEVDHTISAYGIIQATSEVDLYL